MEAILSNKVYCIGCGVEIQSEDQNKQGYLPKSVVEKSIDGNLVCKRCFRLKNYMKYLMYNLELKISINLSKHYQKKMH